MHLIQDVELPTNNSLKLMHPGLEVDPATLDACKIDHILIFKEITARQAAVVERLKASTIHSHDLNGKKVVLIDKFFSDAEGEQMRQYTESLPFTAITKVNDKAIEKGHVPAKNLTLDKRFEFLISPNSIALDYLYQLFSYLGKQMDAVASTHRWSGDIAPTFVTSYYTENSLQSEGAGYHVDYDPKTGDCCNFPKIYEHDSHASTFDNGAQGHPYLLSVILYVAAANFDPNRGLGTLLKESETKSFTVKCQHMRLMLFEADILHTTQHSDIPAGEVTYRVSYVWKICFRPRSSSTPSLRDRFAKLFARPS